MAALTPEGMYADVEHHPARADAQTPLQSSLIIVTYGSIWFNWIYLQRSFGLKISVDLSYNLITNLLCYSDLGSTLIGFRRSSQLPLRLHQRCWCATQIGRPEAHSEQCLLYGNESQGYQVQCVNGLVWRDRHREQQSKPQLTWSWDGAPKEEAEHRILASSPEGS